MAERLIWLLTDASLVDRLGRAARKRAMGHDVYVIARSLLDALRRAAEGASETEPTGASETMPAEPAGRTRATGAEGALKTHAA
jgi:hypothetical protein